MSEIMNVSSEQTQKLQNIENQLSQLSEKKLLLEQKRDSQNTDAVDDLENQITLIEQKINELKTQRQKIISQTQGSLDQARSLNTKEQENAMSEISKQTNLTSEEKKLIQQNLASGEYDFMNNIDAGSGILTTLLSLFASLFRPTYMTIDGEEQAYTTREKLNPITDQERLDFVKEAKKHAQTIEAKYGIPWEISLAQCILESGWGRSKLAREHGNYFGIKGKGVALMTKEDYGKGLVNEKAEFRTYKNMEDSFEAYAQFLIKNPRYKNAFQYASNNISNTNHFPKEHKGRDALQFGIALWRAGYATDSKYDQKLASVMARIEKSDV